MGNPERRSLIEGLRRYLPQVAQQEASLPQRISIFHTRIQIFWSLDRRMGEKAAVFLAFRLSLSRLVGEDLAVVSQCDT
jgi:hypothetical protein